jgi:hypothetical protein
VATYDPGSAGRGSWHLHARSRRIVLAEWRTVRAYEEAGVLEEVRPDGAVWV